jgi:hypothetical protein
MEKTVLQWLETIAEDEIRERAIVNAINQMVNDDPSDSLLDSIGAFIWADCKEPLMYWDDIYEIAKKGQLPTREVDQVDEDKKTLTGFSDLLVEPKDIEAAINILKSEGYKVMKPTTTWEEV